jgi:soluble lytic murein transglycosylase-like protein
MNLASMIAAAAQDAGVPVQIALAVAQRESGMCHWWASGQVMIGSSGEVGVMQVMPATAPGADLYDVAQNIRAGVGYLAQLYRQFGSWDLAAAAYNWGPARVADYVAGRRQLPGSVQAYARAVAGGGADISSAGYQLAQGSARAPAGSGTGTVWAALGVSALAVALLS